MPNKVTQQDAICTFGGLNFLPSRADKRSALWYIEALGNDSSWGDPEQTITEVESQLVEGAAISVSAAGNRTMTLQVQVIGINSAALAQGEAALVAACDRDGDVLFRFLNPDRIGAVTVFEVIDAHLVANLEDLEDERLGRGRRRRYTLTLTAKPWPRSEETVSVSYSSTDSDPVGDELLSDGSDVDNWTVKSGAVIKPGDPAPDDARWAPKDGAAIWGGGSSSSTYLVWKGVVDTTSRPLVRVRGYLYSQSTPSHSYSAPSVSVTQQQFISGDPVSIIFDGNRFDITIQVGENGFDSLKVKAGAYENSSVAPTVLAIDDVTLRANNTVLDTDNISTRVVPVEGAKPTEPTIDTMVTSETLAYGANLVYTGASDIRFVGSLLPYRVSGPARVEVGAGYTITGGRSPLGAQEGLADVFRIPVGDLTPGTYQIAALLSSTIGVDHAELRWKAETAVYDPSSGDPQYLTGGVAGVAHPTLAATDASVYRAIGDVTLPLRDNFEDSVAHVEMKIWCPGVAGNDGTLFIDTALLFNVSSGALTVVHPSRIANTIDFNLKRITFQAPTNQAPTSKVWLDYGEFVIEGGADVAVRGVHRFDPPGAKVWTANCAPSEGHYVSIFHYPRWHTYAASIASLAPVTITYPAADAIMNSSAVTVEGTAVVGANVTIIVDGREVVTVPADDGTWSYRPPKPFADGEHHIVAYQTDTHGHVSPPAEITFTVDTKAPVAPVITSPVDGSQLNFSTFSIAGTAEPNTLVTLTLTNVTQGTETTVTDIQVTEAGTWSTIVETDPEDDTFQAVAFTKDQAENKSPISEPVTFSLDFEAPRPPVVTYPGRRAISDATPTFTGIGGAGATIRITGRVELSTVVDADGRWSVTSTPLPEGDSVVHAVQIDPAGNASEPRDVWLTVDTVPPPAPAIATIDGQDIGADGQVSTQNTRPVINGTGNEEGDQVRVLIDDMVAGTSPIDTVDDITSWSVIPLTALEVGAHTVTAIQLDEAGNESDPSDPVTLEVTATWEQVATNLALDPSFELGETSEYWDIGTSGAEWVDADDAYAGGTVLRIPGGNKKVLSTWWLPPEGGVFDLAMRARVTGDTTPSIRFANLDGVGRGSAVEVGEADGWSIYAATGVTLPKAESSSAYWRVSLGAGGGSQVDDFIEVDAVIVATANELTDPTEYFDGDTPDADQYRYEWTGEPHVSTSVKHARLTTQTAQTGE